MLVVRIRQLILQFNEMKQKYFNFKVLYVDRLLRLQSQIFCNIFCSARVRKTS